MASNFWSSTHCNHWIISRSTLSHSRTLDTHYLSPRQIALLHIFFSSLISKLGKKLSLRHVPIHTAIVYFKRFYLTNGFVETDPWTVAAGCVYVAAKVEETPMHIKTVVAEARSVFAEYGIKSFPTEYTKLAEMEFYLLEDLEHDLVIFHPHRSLLTLCNREPADGADGSEVGLEEENRSGSSKKRKREIADDDGLDGMGRFGEGAVKRVEKVESAADRVNRTKGRGTGSDALEVEDSVVQMAWFILNDTYRTDLILLHPPHIIALAALYLSFSLSDTKPDATSHRVKGKKWIPLEVVENNAIEDPTIVNGGRGLLTRFDAPAWFAGLKVGSGVVLEAVQELVSVYTLWEELDSGSPGGQMGGKAEQKQQQQPGTAAGHPLSMMGTNRSNFSLQAMNGGAGSSATAATSTPATNRTGKEQKISEKDVVGLLQRVQLERSVDVSHPQDGGAGRGG